MDLTAAFRDVPRVGRVRGCTHCYTDDQLALLGGDPDRVPDDLLRHFAWKSWRHWPEEQYPALWRGLAPRILALLADEPDTRYLSNLAGAAFATWPDHQRQAFRTAVCELVDRAVTGDRSTHDLDELVCAAAHLDHDLAPWLAHLDTLGPDADAGLARLAEHWAASQSLPILWWHPPDGFAPVRAWLHSGPLYDRLDRANALTALEAITDMWP
ncbi:hypothetical protein JOF53_001527 [Crossiella equi]|uniref:Uncharacterized protein n=1 Tax=Crossiella equi TaxID=130796 RepID=A0ABS5A7V5_9PSEU|nr:hypothetical protein [Crossiella equi]MBP2472655.1 hypothetical protein [Crossiella equi]